MVKLSASKDKKIRASNSVRRIRDRYARALALGYTVKDAARLASGDGEIVNPGKSTPVEAASIPAKEEPVDVQHISGGGSSPPEQESSIAREDIPPNWQDLPWPQLRLLAVQLSGLEVRSRKQATEVIEAALTKTSEQ